MIERPEERKERGSARIVLLFFVVIALSWSFKSAHAARTFFPEVDRASDYEEILETHPAYLKFVLAIGQKSNKRMAKKLHKKYRILRKYSPRGAAKFLKGLRYELVVKQRLDGIAQNTSTRNRVWRRFVRRNLGNWYREADEHLFRAVVKRRMDRTQVD